jgi:pilus assembly protein CpaF
VADAWSLVEAEVRRAVRDRGFDPAVHRDEVQAIAEAAVSAYEERSLVTPMPELGEPVHVVRRLVDAVAGFGAIQPYLDDPEVEEIWINAPSRVFVARNGTTAVSYTHLTLPTTPYV